MASITAVPSQKPHWLGVHVLNGGVNVAVYAANATQVHLCLFDESGAETQVALFGPQTGVWHAYIPGLRAGQRYAFRASGPWNPADGHRYNPAKLLLDPYGRAIDGEITPITSAGGPTLLSNRASTDSAPFMPRNVVTQPRVLPPNTRPRIPWPDTVVYEVHVKGFTWQMPGIPDELRGTYAGLAHPVAIEYLKSLGVTSVELLPIHASANEQHLERLGLTNYWGYSTLGYFAPNPAYATKAARDSGPQAVVDECAGMVTLLHEAGLEVILDVVYNHTAEGSASDRVFSWKGLDNSSYYRSQEHNPGQYDDTTGTGNTLDFAHERVVQMALDSLRYWGGEIGVDGFRFDLAVTLGRTGQGFSSRHPFLVGLITDPILSGLKLIAEPWDVGLGGWQVGNFPAPISEWNDRFRDRTRTFWLTDVASGSPAHYTPTAADLATRLSGSQDLFGHSRPVLMRGPLASINFVTAHDGFTLWDLVSYNGKHNEANGEQNRDGTTNNNSWNHGAEGPTDDASIMQDRLRAARNLLATTVLAAGVPMLLAGDEHGNSQGGNNNAYCQDSEIGWVSWPQEPWQHELRQSLQELLRLRAEHRVLRPTEFYDGGHEPASTTHRADLAFFTDAGAPATDEWWESPTTRVVQMMRSTGDVAHADALIVINGSTDKATVALPVDAGKPWQLAWDTTCNQVKDSALIEPGQHVESAALSLQVYLSQTV